MYYTYLHSHQLKDVRHQPVEGAKPNITGWSLHVPRGKPADIGWYWLHQSTSSAVWNNKDDPLMESWQNNVFYPELRFFWLVSEPSVSPERCIFDDLWLALIIFDDRWESLTILNPELGFLVPQRQHHDAKYNGFWFGERGHGISTYMLLIPKKTRGYLSQRKLVGHIPFPVQGNESMP